MRCDAIINTHLISTNGINVITRMNNRQNNYAAEKKIPKNRNVNNILSLIKQVAEEDTKKSSMSINQFPLLFNICFCTFIVFMFKVLMSNLYSAHFLIFFRTAISFEINKKIIILILYINLNLIKSVSIKILQISNVNQFSKEIFLRWIIKIFFFQYRYRYVQHR